MKLTENLAYKVLWGMSACNGGEFNYEKYLPIKNKPGPWLPEIEYIKLYTIGYHLTLGPHRWRGNRVFLCEYRGKSERKSDKIVVSSFRFLKEITISNCIDPSIFVRIADLRYADLSGVDLSWAELQGADLYEANLSYANLIMVNFRRANLSYADLRGANLYGADLSGAKFYMTILTGANLIDANLEGQDIDDLRKRGAII